MAVDTSFNAFAVAQSQFDRIADLMALGNSARKFLRTPSHEHRFSLPVRLDSGEVEVFEGFRVQHNDARGPAWGGVRFHPLETIDTIRALAMWTTWKTAMVDIPVGGSMGGVICDPHDLSHREIESICRCWIRRVDRCIGPNRDIPAPDVMTSGRHMTWMLDEFEAIHGEHRPGAVTGKTVGAGGSLGRTEAGGYGLVYCLREALKEVNLEPADTTASIQGFGNVAQHALELYSQIGGRVVCVSSWNQATGAGVSFHKEQGVDLQELRSASDHLGSIDPERAADLGYEVLDGDAWMRQEVDILIPAAIEHQITTANVGSVSDRVKVLAEGADGSTSPDAEGALLGRGVAVIPDLLTNAGGLVCSYFEQVQSTMNYYWSLSEVLSKLDVQLTAAYVAASDLARAKKLSMRDAALVIAVNRVATQCEERGWL